VLSKMSRTGGTLTRMKARYRWAAVLTVLLGGGTVATIGGPVSPASAAITRLEATVFNVLDFRRRKPDWRVSAGRNAAP
jgi:hypothetical protein